MSLSTFYLLLLALSVFLTSLIALSLNKLKDRKDKFLKRKFKNKSLQADLLRSYLKDKI